MSDVDRTAASEQDWRRKEPTPRRKQSTQTKQLTARNKNALALVTIQENKITPNRTGGLFIFARYTLCLRIQWKHHINFIVNKERYREN